MFMVKKEEDVPAGSCQHTVRPLSREYASVTQKLCRDGHKGGEGYLHSRNSVLCISVLSADKQAWAWAKQRLVVTSGS